MDKSLLNKEDILIFNLNHNRTNIINPKLILLINNHPHIWTQTFQLDNQSVNPNMETILNNLFSNKLS